MRALILALVLSLSACATPAPTGVYKLIHGDMHYTAIAVSTKHLVGLLHDAVLWDRVQIRTQHGDLWATVIEVYEDACRFEMAEPGGIDVRRGDSGSGVFNKDGKIIGVIEGRRAW